jgi:predicted DNA-binding protein (MmcQ/YjbR family)
MARTDKVLAKLQELILSFPDAKLSMSWGKPHFKVADKIFAGFGEIDDKPVLTLRLEAEHTKTRLDSDPRFRPSRYEGAVEMNVDSVQDWNEIRSFLLESYRSVAPKKSLTKLGGGGDSEKAGAGVKSPKGNAAEAKKPQRRNTRARSR